MFRNYTTHRREYIHNVPLCYAHLHIAGKSKYGRIVQQQQQQQQQLEHETPQRLVMVIYREIISEKTGVDRTCLSKQQQLKVMPRHTGVFRVMLTKEIIWRTLNKDVGKLLLLSSYELWICAMEAEN
ncbi:unnamed protein product [Ceratitis capitata]|uniref:(Mediterranean fruit fly) hypothetical protein n=1 Tax=Ceratitis capitata TaxID=7213 RepID=A0A811UNU3_CERCA|nr:unnamed protein product [Ceratitis capitata]